MVEIAWRYRPDEPLPNRRPATPEEARRLLVEGNQAFARLGAEGQTSRLVIDVAASNLGIRDPGVDNRQRPMAAVLSCADARVPLELITGQAADGLFVVRVAGNLPGAECIGSLDFAIDTIDTLRLLITLGHTGCGALNAAVDAYLTPAGYLGVAANFPLRAIVDSLLPVVRGADVALALAHGEGVRASAGYRAALVELGVILNAALTSMVIHDTFKAQLHDGLAVAFAVYNLENRLVGLPGDAGWEPGLSDPPLDRAAFVAFAQRMAATGFIAGRL